MFKLQVLFMFEFFPSYLLPFSANRLFSYTRTYAIFLVITHMCTGGEYPGLPCPLVSRWSSEPLRSSWADCIRIEGLPLSIPGGLPPSRPGGLPPNSPGGLPPIRPDASPPRRPWLLPPIGPVEPLFMRPGVPSKGREVSARAACRREGDEVS